MFNLGPTELILILVVALVIFGPGKLPEVGSTLGKAIREFKSAINKVDADIKQEVGDVVKEVAEVKDAVNIKDAMKDLQTEIKDAVIIDVKQEDVKSENKAQAVVLEKEVAANQTTTG